MYTIILFAVIFLIWRIWWVIKYDDLFTPIDGINIISYFGAILLGAAVGIGIAVLIPPKLEDKNYTLTLVSLQDNPSVQGRFYLGYGSVSGTFKYTFYYQVDSETFRMRQVDYTNAEVKYTSGAPSVFVYHKEEKPILYNRFTLHCPWNDTYVLKVPKGSIKTDYSLDAK